MKKHFTQMSDTEKQTVKTIVKERGRFRINPYTKIRMNQRNISDIHLAITLLRGEVIEVHNDTPNEIRALFRSTIDNKACCVVVCLNQPKVVTCYWNKATDKHSTLDHNRYQWNANLLPILAEAEAEARGKF